MWNGPVVGRRIDAGNVEGQGSVSQATVCVATVILRVATYIFFEKNVRENRDGINAIGQRTDIAAPGPPRQLARLQRVVNISDEQ